MATPQQRATQVIITKIELMAHRIATETAQALDADDLLADALEIDRQRARADRAEHKIRLALARMRAAPGTSGARETLVHDLINILEDGDGRA